MKKVLLIVLLLVSVCNISFASTPPEQDTKQLMIKFTEARFKLESGVSYHDFQDIKQGLYVATKMYSENYPDGEFNGKFNDMLTMYADTFDFWKYKISYDGDRLPESYSICQYYTKNYPDVMAKNKEIGGNGYLINNIVSGLFNHISDKTKELNQAIKDKYAQ